MTYSYRNSGQITDFTPDNDENTLYIQCDITGGIDLINELPDRIRNHFGIDPTEGNFTIEAEYIHTHCLTYDQYDPSDYTNFLVIRRIK